MTPTAATPTGPVAQRGKERIQTKPGSTVLKRTKVARLRAGESPFRRNAEHEWQTNAKPLYARREPGKAPAIRLQPGPTYVALMTDDELAAASATAERHGWELIETRHDLIIPPRKRWAHLDGDLDCDPKLLDKLNRVARDLGVIILVRSGARTMAEQWALYNQLGPGIAAYPSASAPHVRGIAADCGINGVNIGAYPGAREAMLEHGLCLRVANENWHVEIGARDRWAENWLPK